MTNFATSAEGYAHQKNMQHDHSKHVGSQCYSVGIKSIRKKAPEKVYNMEVDTYHNFGINNGIISHNCIDAVRYATYQIWKRKGD